MSTLRRDKGGRASERRAVLITAPRHGPPPLLLAGSTPRLGTARVNSREGRCAAITPRSQIPDGLICITETRVAAEQDITYCWKRLKTTFQLCVLRKGPVKCANNVAFNTEYYNYIEKYFQRDVIEKKFH